MRISKSTRYNLARLAVIPLAYIVYRFFKKTNFYHGAVLPIVVEGMLIIILIGGMVIIQAYYRKNRFDAADQSRLGSEVGAYGALARTRLKPVTVRLHISSDELNTLINSGELVVKPERFNTALRHGDKVILGTADANDYLGRHATVTIMRIDGVNQRVVLS